MPSLLNGHPVLSGIHMQRYYKLKFWTPFFQRITNLLCSKVDDNLKRVTERGGGRRGGRGEGERETKDISIYRDRG